MQIAGDFSLQRTGKEYPVSIVGKPFSAEADTGASFSLISASTARKWGLTLLEGTSKLHGYGSGAFAANPAVIPELQIGKAELHDVVVMVTADENLYIAEISSRRMR